MDLRGVEVNDEHWQEALLRLIRQRRVLHALLEDCRSSFAIHLAVLNEPYLTRMIDGLKTVESRFSVHKQPPFGRVREGDVLLLKRVSGPVIAACVVDYVWDYELNDGLLEEIESKFAILLCADDPSFWQARKDRNYATLMRVGNVMKIEPLACEKRDRRGWVVLRSRDDLQL